MPQPAPIVPPNPVGLEEAVAYAYQNNPRVGEAAALIREARGRVLQQRALRLPQFGVNNFVFRQGPVIPGATPGSNPAVPPWRYNVGIFVSQIVFDWGQRRLQQRAAERDRDAAAYRMGEVQNDVRFVVGNTYFNMQRAQQLVQVAEERVKATSEQLRVARARYETDVAPRFDVIRSEAELADAQQELIQAQNDVILSEAAFNTALGRDVTTPVVVEPVALPPTPEAEFQDLRAAGRRNRPQLEAIRQEIQASEATVRARRRENLPQIGFLGTYDRPNPGGFASQTYRYNVGLTMTFPFFDSGFTRGRVHEAQGTLEADRYRLEQARQQMELDIRQAQFDVREALARIETAQKQLASAREAARVAEVRYRSGVGINVEVTDALVAVASAGQNLANSQFDYLTALLRLEVATGTDVAGLTPEPQPVRSDTAAPMSAPPAVAPPAAPSTPDSPGATPRTENGN